VDAWWRQFILDFGVLEEKVFGFCWASRILFSGILLLKYILKLLQ